MNEARPLKVGILEAGPVRPALRQRHGTHGDFFRAWLAPRAPDWAFPVWPAYEGALPERADDCDAYIVTGSRYSTYDPLPWIAALKDFVRAAAQSRPLVGICFGHQLIADAFGGRVERSMRGWGIGVHRYEVFQRRPWMEPQLPSLALIVSHQDQVVEPPPGARILAGSAFCPIGMFELGDTILALQAHPEATADYSRDLYTMRRQSHGDAATAAAVATLSMATDEAAVAGWVLRFLCAPDKPRL